MITDEAKEAVRRRILDKRKGLGPSYRQEASDIIRDHVISLDEWKSAHTVYLYMNTGSEVSTEALIKETLSEGKAVYLPKVTSSSGMSFYRIYSVRDLKEGAFGILEPDICEAGSAEDDEPDIVVVPCVACDAAGHRMGHGRGYYDRFFGRIKGGVKVCTAFDCQMENEIITDEHDVDMDIIITESGIIRI